LRLLFTVNLFDGESTLRDGARRAVWLQFAKEAAPVTLVTHPGPHGIYTDEQRIGVAIEEDLPYAQEVAAGFAFLPKALAGAAEKVDLAGALGALERFGIQESKHEHFLRGVVLNDGGNQPVHFRKAKFHQSLPKNEKPAGANRASGLIRACCC